MGALMLEGHGYTLPGSFTVPQGTWLQLSRSGGLLDEGAARAVAARGTFRSGTGYVLGPGSSAPNLVLTPPTMGMFVRPSSTTVTRPTLLSDILDDGMGLCVWAACR